MTFFRSMSQGWLAYYKHQQNSGPKFSEEQIRMADRAADTLQGCSPIHDFLDPITHAEVCKNLGNGQFTKASTSLEMAPPELDLNLNKAGCIEALKIGVWLLGSCAPETIRLATLNLLACEYYFPTI